jgi:hydroxypyruvate isomerase
MLARMDRRSFCKYSALGAPALSVSALSASAPAIPSPGPRAAGQRFKLKYAPHFGMFQHHAGTDLFDQIRFMADEGFRALEDNWIGRRPPDVQEKIGALLAELGMEMGVFVAHFESAKPGLSFVSDSDEARARIAADMESAVEIAKRCAAKWCTVVPGPVQSGVEFDYQTANAIDNLRRAAEICEPSGLTMVLEPLNPWRDHAGLFLSKIPQAFLICRGVDSPACKILDDLYHQQITEGNLIPNIDKAWGEIAYFQVGDNPGRKEPGTGEINYRNVFRHIHQRGFEGVIGMEHGNAHKGKEGERAVIDAYVSADSF